MAKRADTLTADEQRAYAVRQAQMEIDRILATFPELRHSPPPATSASLPPDSLQPTHRPRRPTSFVSAATRKRMAARMKARWRDAKAKGRKKL